MAGEISRNLAALRMLLAFVAAVTLPFVVCDDMCSATLYTKPQQRRFYCDNNTSKILEGLEFNNCKLYCFNRGSCAGLSYNLTTQLVSSFRHKFQKIRLWDMFISTHQQYPCLSWVNYRPANLIRGYQDVARGKHENQWVPWKYLYAYSVSMVVRGSSELCSGQGKISVIWGLLQCCVGPLHSRRSFHGRCSAGWRVIGCAVCCESPGPLLLTWFNLNPSMDKWLYPL